MDEIFLRQLWIKGLPVEDGFFNIIHRESSMFLTNSFKCAYSKVPVIHTDPIILRLSPPLVTFFPISEFSYKLIRFLLHNSVIKSDNEIGKVSYQDIKLEYLCYST